MLRIPKGWFKSRSHSGTVPETKPEAVNGSGHKPGIYEEAVSWENSRQDRKSVV